MNKVYRAKILIPKNSNFNYSECQQMYKENQKAIGDNQSFDSLIENTFFYSFFVENKHIGCIYYYERNNKLFVNAFANRHTHLINIYCLKESLSWWNCDIYAKTSHKQAIYTILKCGFKKISKNIYKYER